MNTRNFLNLSLALALAGLIALLIYDPGKHISTSKIFLTQLKPADIQNLIIEQTQNGQIPIRIVLTKPQQQWQMSSPYQHPANTLRINKFLELAKAVSHAQYLAIDVDLKQLKLSPPDLTIILNDTKLFFGTTDALKGYQYIQINGAIHLINDRFSYLVRGQADKLLSPDLLPTNARIIKIVLPEQTLQKNDMGWISNSNKKTVSADKIQQFLDEWRFARALSVNKIANIEMINPTEVITIYDDKNQLYKFNLMRTEDEVILLRTDTGLRYHFAAESGEKLLTPQSR